MSERETGQLTQHAAKGLTRKRKSSLKLGDQGRVNARFRAIQIYTASRRSYTTSLKVTAEALLEQTISNSAMDYYIAFPC